jgi:predicted nucleic acid-binding protein
VVLDTNVLLDLVVFADPAASLWHVALSERRVRAIANEATLQEWTHVVARPLGPRWDSRRSRAADTGVAFEWCLWPGDPPAAPTGLRCSDPDDQKFLDLALASGAQWLLTRDRALLRLAKVASRHGLQVLRPSDAAPP